MLFSLCKYWVAARLGYIKIIAIGPHPFKDHVTIPKIISAEDTPLNDLAP